QFAGYYAAIEKGYYREAGLNVTLIEAKPDHDPVQAVLDGEADFGVGTSELILLRNENKPIVILADIYQHSPLILLTRQDKAEDIQDLHDKVIMIEPQSAELYAYFKYEGIDPLKLHTIPHTFNVNDLISGKVAAMSAYSTDEPYILSKAGIKYCVLTPREGGIDFYGDNLFTTEAVIRKNPDEVHAFLAASLKGWEYAMSHQEEIVDLILRKYNTQGKTREQLLFEASHTAQLLHPGLIEIGHINKGRWQHIANTYAEFGMLPQNFSLKGLLYEQDSKTYANWIYWLLAGIATATIAALLWLYPLIQLNRNLRSEIRERRKVESLLRESEKQYRNLAEQVPFPVSITDMDTQLLLFANRQATDLMEISYGDAVGTSALIFHSSRVDRERFIAQVRSGQEIKNLELSLRKSTGETVWVLLSAALVEFSGRKAMVAAFQDITYLREMQQELLKAKDHAETANAAKGSYLAIMTHELRSPITGIIGLARLMKDELKSPDQRENLDLIANTGESLNTLIGDILDHSKLEAGRVELEMEPINIRDFTGDLCRLFNAPAEAKKITLNCHIDAQIPTSVITDSMRLRQILGNLCTNAIKFTEVGGVDISVAATRTPDALWRLHFEVSDTGIGIASEETVRIFEPYVQANSVKRYGGTGLGLTISRDLARLLGGELSVKSTPGKGSRFTLEILAKEVVDL
ncbi:MAG: ABC transporter substrate-binding protein, partial [Chthoniobacterales bacterium]